jgi:acyl dehydratase|tara:strand:- start:16049 stop:16585 length:537 start_codon:yes stop_codon:yes gene_type:complete
VSVSTVDAADTTADDVSTPTPSRWRTVMTTVFASPDELPDAVGTHLGYGDWITVDQDRIDLFAEATGDHQWIHVDPERAAAGPFGATIAHGYLTLALTNQMLPGLVRVDGISMGINYGTDKVRFPSPVVVGSRVRGGAELVQVDEVAGGYQAVIRIIVEVEGSDRPACVVDSVSRFLR